MLFNVVEVVFPVVVRTQVVDAVHGAAAVAAAASIKGSF